MVYRIWSLEVMHSEKNKMSLFYINLCLDTRNYNLIIILIIRRTLIYMRMFDIKLFDISNSFRRSLRNHHFLFWMLVNKFQLWTIAFTEINGLVLVLNGNFSNLFPSIIQKYSLFIPQNTKSHLSDTIRAIHRKYSRYFIPLSFIVWDTSGILGTAVASPVQERHKHGK